MTVTFMLAWGGLDTVKVAAGWLVPVFLGLLAGCVLVTPALLTVVDVKITPVWGPLCYLAPFALMATLLMWSPWWRLPLLLASAPLVPPGELRKDPRVMASMKR